MFKHFWVVFFIIVTIYSNRSFANTAPVFTGGHSQDFTVCQYSNPNPINNLLKVNDLDIGQTETWTLISGAFHGSVSSFYTFTSTGAVMIPVGLNYTPAGGYTGNDTFQFRVTDGLASDTTTVYVTVVPYPQPGVITGPISVCTGATIALIDTATGGTWSSLMPIATVSPLGIVTGVSAGTDTIMYTVTNFCGLVQTRHAITVYTSADYGIITGPDSVCIGGVISLFETSSIGYWGATNTKASVVFGVVSAMAVGIDTILYTATNAYCTTSAMHPITINPLPSVSLISDGPNVCQGAIITLTDSVAGGVWSLVNANATISSATGLLNGVIPGVDTVWYTLTTSCGTASISKQISINPLPVVAPITGVSAICITSPFVLVDSTGGGIWYSSSPIATVSSGLVTCLGSGIDTIKYGVTNSCGTTVATHPFTIYPLPQAGSITGGFNVCVGSESTLSDTVSGGIWRFTNGNAYILDSIVTGFSVGQDTIYYKITNLCGMDSTMAVLNVNPLPYPGAISGTNTICPKDTEYVYESVMGGVWASSNPVVARIDSFTNDTARVVGYVAGTVTFTYTVANSCGAGSAYYTLTVGDTLLCPSAVPQLNSQNIESLVVVPNPNNGEFNITLGGNATQPLATTCIITNSIGEEVGRFEAFSNKVASYRMELPNAVYFVTAINQTGKWVSKLLINK